GALLPHHFTLAGPPFTWDGGRRRFVSVALSRGFPRVDLSTTLPCDVRTFLEGSGPPRPPDLPGQLSGRGARWEGLNPRGGTAARATAASNPPEQTHNASEHLDLFAANRLHRLVLRLQPHVVRFTEEALDGGLLAEERHDHVAVGRRVLRMHDHVVAFEDARVLHRVAANPQQVFPVLAARDLGHRHVLLDVLLRQHRLTGGHRAEQREAFRAHDAADAVHRAPHRPVQQLDGPGLRGVAPQKADLLQVGQMRVHGRRGRQAHRLADVAHRGRVAVLGGVLADEVEDLLLALGQIHAWIPPLSG